MELDSTKSHIAEQEAAMEELQTELNEKEQLLNTISMAACKSHPSKHKISWPCRQHAHTQSVQLESK